MKEETENNNSSDQILSYIALLGEINKRISSKKEGSELSLKGSVLSASFDKLHLSFKEPILTKLLVSNAARNGFKFSADWQKRTPFILLEKENLQIRLPDKENSSVLYTNPSKSETWYEFENNLSSVLSDIPEQNTKVSRLDLALNLNAPVSEVIPIMDVKNTKSSNLFSYESDQSTKNNALRLGKKPRQIEVYDYGLKHYGQSDIETRLEERLYASKLPVRDWKDIPNLDLYKKAPFSDVLFKQHKVPGSVQNLNEKTKRLSILLNDVGYLRTKAILNTQGNFKRDYQAYMTIKEFSETPGQLFAEKIQTDYIK